MFMGIHMHCIGDVDVYGTKSAHHHNQGFLLLVVVVFFLHGFKEMGFRSYACEARTLLIANSQPWGSFTFCAVCVWVG